MINKKEISIIQYTSLVETISSFYQEYTLRNLKKRTLEYFKKNNINPEETMQSDWKKATDIVMKARERGILSKYFETVEEQVFNTTSVVE